MITEVTSFKEAREKIQRGEVRFGDPQIIKYLNHCEIQEQKREARERCCLCYGKGMIVRDCDECEGTGKNSQECQCQSL